MMEPHGFARWKQEVVAFEQADREKPPPRHAILFVGSSTIRRRETPARDFPDHHVINRGFGGSEVVDVSHFAERIILPYQPKLIFFRTGGNAIAAGKSPEQVIADIKEVVAMIHARLPETEIIFISLRASIARRHLAEQNKLASMLIEKYVKGNPRLRYIDADDVSIGPEGKPRPELFADDNLHYNAKGYKLLADRIRPLLPAS